MKIFIPKYLAAVFILFSVNLFSQTPDFKFHLAFEDANGSKDTVWMVWDTLATFGYDPIFGETPQSMPNDTTFRVYIKNSPTDSMKVRSLPLTITLGNFRVEAVNYTYPVILKWDSTLFTQNDLTFQINRSTLENDWFFFNWNDANFQNQFNMLITDSIYLPLFGWGSQNHFPLDFQIGYDPSLSIYEEYNEGNVLLYPNPASDNTILKFNHLTSAQIFIYNLMGKQVLTDRIISSKFHKIDIGSLENGVYIISVKTESGVITKKIIVTD